MYFWDGRKFEGEYVNGKLNGIGTEIDPKGLKWKGIWRDGIKD